MKRETTEAFYKRRIREQRAWIATCGGTLAGYISHYIGLGNTAEYAEKIYKADTEYLAKTEEAFEQLGNDSKTPTSVLEAIENALSLLESLGYVSGGDIHDDLANAALVLRADGTGTVQRRELPSKPVCSNMLTVSEAQQNPLSYRAQLARDMRETLDQGTRHAAKK